VAGDRPGSVLTLKDGRRLGYAEYGNPQGKPLFFFHGMPGSRLEGELADAAAKKLGVRVIATDRPGYGLSDFQPRRTFLDWPADVVALADALAIDRFAVAGVSGGGPYVAACALGIPERLTGAGIIAGVGPYDQPDATEGMGSTNRMLFGLAKRFPWLIRLLMAVVSFATRHFADRMMSAMVRSLPKPDQVAVKRPEIMAMFKQDTTEAFRSGSRGAAWETLMYARPWGFGLEGIAMEVHLWQGEQDKNVAPSMGHYQARAIPNCRANFYPDEGHISLAVNHIEEILATLVARG
jgi:pimeloyl-ACP methyl ester carboxylesterase